MKTCIRCSAPWPETTEYWSSRYKGRLSGVCRVCTRADDLKRYHQRKIKKDAIVIPPNSAPELPKRDQIEAVKRTPTERGTVRVTFGSKYMIAHREPKVIWLQGYESSLAGIY